MNHTQLLNHLIAKYDLKSYREIGVQNPGNNYNKINCKDKEGCDPDVAAKAVGVFTLTSDQYFAHLPEYIHGDLFFIDGLHTAEQVKKDFENSLRHLNPGGFIVVHDVLPDGEEFTQVPRTSKKWYGNVYLWALQVISLYDGIDFFTLNIDCGCMVIWRDDSKKMNRLLTPVLSWSAYMNIREHNMRIIELADLDRALPVRKEVGV